jgi:hypothetical protein
MPQSPRSLLVLSSTFAALLPSAAAQAVPPVFSNQTASTGIVSTHATSGFAQFVYAGGAAVGDFDRDGRQDLFVISGGSGGQPDRLFMNNGDGTFTNRAAEWGLTLVHKGKSVCVGDYDNDGWLDLYVTSAGPVGQNPGPGHHKLYRNNGNGTFTNVAAAAGVATADATADSAWSSVFGDYDLDGDLDLFVTGFAGTPSNTEHRLFRNNGNGTFTNVTTSIGLFAGIGPVAGLSARFVDMNGDRYPELLLGGDFKGTGQYVGSRYFANDGDGTFTDRTVASGTGKEENGMGQTVGDFDNDLRTDWYVTSIFHPPFNWTGNKLYRNVATHSFVEMSGPAGVADGGYGWGAVAVDFNHDGWLDIAETNGDGTAGSPFFNEQSYLWMNDGVASPLRFTEQALAAGFSHFGRGRALLSFDYDDDGDQDLVLVAALEPLTVFRNDIAPGGPETAWLRVFLDTSARPGLAPDGFGAKVVVEADGIARMRTIDGGVSYLGTSELSAHVGLGSAQGPAKITVAWPDGSTTTLENVALNQTLVVAAAPTSCLGDLDADGTVGPADLAVLLGSWSSSSATADLDGDGVVDPRDLAIVLGAWGSCAGR